MRVSHGSILVGLGIGLAGAGTALGHQPGAPPTAPGATAKLAPALRNAAGRQRLIVQFRLAAGDPDHRALVRAGARVMRRYRTLPMVAVEADRNDLMRIAAIPAVTRISPDTDVRRTLEYGSPAVGADLARAQFGATGRGVGVAVIDSGIALEDDLSVAPNFRISRVVAGYDFLCRAAIRSNNDLCGHGSSVAGIVAGNGFSSNVRTKNGHTYRRFIGVAPEAHLINLRVLDQQGVGSVSGAIAALDWCIQNRGRYNIRVANLSLGHPVGESYTTDPLCQAAERAWKAGIVVVCAAGNRGRLVPMDPNGGVSYGTINSPGNDPFVLTVGAVNTFGTAARSDDWVTSYSSRGPTRFDEVVKPDLVTPGNRIVSLRQARTYLERVVGKGNVVSPAYYWVGTPNSRNVEYYRLSGTSMAAGFASGAAALMLQKDPRLTPDDVKARLMKTADKVWHRSGTTPDIWSRGAGYLNVPAALRCRDRVSAFALSPIAVGSTSDVDFELLERIWGQQALWGEEMIWGQQALWGGGKPQSFSNTEDTGTYDTMAGDISSIAVSGE